MKASRILLLFWPTLLWFLGYLEYFTQVYWGAPSLRMSGISVFVSILILICCLFFQLKAIRSFIDELLDSLASESKIINLLLWALIGVQFLIFFVSALESRSPPHLPQENDAINYHYALVKQHLLHGSFHHINWFSADLWPMPIQYGIGPFWFLDTVYHKIPSFLFSLWIFAMMLGFGLHLSKKKRDLWYLPALIFFTTHGVVIQLGIAMLDLPILYFLTASIYSLFILKNKYLWLGALHLAVFASAKAISPLQTGAVLFVFGIFVLTRKKIDKKFFRLPKKEMVKFFALTFLFFSVLFARSFWVSMHRAGTPLFPFATCIFSVEGCNGPQGEIIKDSAKQQLADKNTYGDGNGPIAFLRHLYLVSVPLKGVNNRYDYPAGFGWLVLMLLFLMRIFTRVPDDRYRVLLYISLSFWVVWWIGSHQTRWLYPVMLFGLLSSIDLLSKVKPQILVSVLLISATLSLASHYRSFAPTLCEPADIIEHQQKSKIKLDPRTKNIITEETLYVDEPLYDHAPTRRYWILR
ncbi:MAG: hypothetical protein AB7F43_03855 [Bacteriovoracia bacterium]